MIKIENSPNDTTGKTKDIKFDGTLADVTNEIAYIIIEAKKKVRNAIEFAAPNETEEFYDDIVNQWMQGIDIIINSKETKHGN